MTDTSPSESEVPAQDGAPTATPGAREPAQGRHTSPTGAVRGHPDAEHGAYGMVREQADPTLSEREIRGVEPALPADKGR